MARICSKCNYSNSNTSHYCVKCGEPLEKTGIFASKPDKIYEVISKSELDSLRKERNTLREQTNRLQKQINNSWGIKTEKWIKDNINTIGWIIVSIVVIAFFGLLITKCDFSPKPSEVVEIRKDATTGKYGLYNKESKTLVLPYDYDSISHRKGVNDQGNWNFFFIHRDGKFGVADSTGTMTIPCQLNAARGLYNGIDILFKDGKQGLMNAYGQLILPCEYQYVLWENESKIITLVRPGNYVGNILPVKANKTRGWELYDRSGKKIRNQHYKAAIQTGDPKLIKVCENRNDSKFLYGIVDENGQTILPCKYYSISVFGDDRAWAKQNYKDPWSLFTSKGNRLTTLSKGVTPSAFSDGLAALTEKSKIGYCDTSGKMVIPFHFEQVRNNDGSYVSYNFHNGKARVSYDGKTGYIDKSGTFTPDITK